MYISTLYYEKGQDIMFKILLFLLLVAVIVGGGWFYLNSNKFTIPTGIQPNNRSIDTTIINPNPVSSTGTSQSNLLEAQAYTNSKFGFSINPAKGWTTKEADQNGIIVVFTNPVDQGNNILITSQSAQGMDLMANVNATKQQLPAYLKNYQLTDNSSTTVNDQPAYIIGGTFVQRNANLRNKQLMVVKNGQVYVVTATAKTDNWVTEQAAIDASLMSFKLQ